MNYSQALTYLKSLSQEDEIFLSHKQPSFSLRNTKHILAYLDNPEKKLKVIHVAGSKGKGSVCAMLASILKEGDFKVGLYTSPHLVEVRERIQINGKCISKRDFAYNLTQLSDIINRQRQIKLSYFECLTVSALMYFARKKVDFAIVEVGLGGRLDATNIVHPIATVLTPIELEHTSILGNSLVKIAKEKLGILKKDVPLFIAQQHGKVTKLAKKRCRLLGNSLFECSRLVKYKILAREIDGYSFWYSCGSRSFEAKSALLGDQQVQNACLTVLLTTTLFPDIPVEIIRCALKSLSWPARFQYSDVDGVPVIFDVAHTISSIKAFLKTYHDLFGDKPKVYVLCFMRDKKVREIVESLESREAYFVCTSCSSPRAFKADELASSIGRGVIAIQDPCKAFDHALKIGTERKACVCVIGSHIHIGQIAERFSYFRNRIDFHV